MLFTAEERIRVITIRFVFLMSFRIQQAFRTRLQGLRLGSRGLQHLWK